MLTGDRQKLSAVGDAAGAKLLAALSEVKRAVRQQELLDRFFVALLTGGHLLVEGVPGLTRMYMARTAASFFGGTFSRVRFTPDLVRADLVGARIYRPDFGRFVLEPGPIFCNFLLADEINRASAKVRSALLEAMQENQVAVEPESYRTSEPFLVMATENPIGPERAHPLSKAELDRFMMKVVVDYPDSREETMAVHHSPREAPASRWILEPEELRALRRAAAGTYVDRLLVGYATELSAATRHPDCYGLLDLAPYVAFGTSPRGLIDLVRASQALALLRGRGYVLPQDVRDIFKDVLRHRLVLTYEALIEEVTPDAILDSVLEAVPEPHVALARKPSA